MTVSLNDISGLTTILKMQARKAEEAKKKEEERKLKRSGNAAIYKYLIEISMKIL